MNIYLYVSWADRIEAPDGFDVFKHFDTDEEAAIKEKANYDAQGFHTLLYKTAGTSSALITEKLLSYSMESIAFIVFHEAFHVHLSRSDCKIHYLFEEATGDIIGNYGSMLFAVCNKLLKPNLSKRQTSLNEHLYHFINETVQKISKSNVQQFFGIYQGCNAKIGKLLKEGTAFQKDRFGYEVNNAYLLRNRYYGENYFLLRSLFQKMKSMAEFVRFMSDLPVDLDLAKVEIRKALR